MPRVICVGDENQSLYRFRGADCRAFRRIGERLSTNGRPMVSMELPLNYRCDQLIIKRAQKWVPAIKGNSQALGTVDVCSFEHAMQRCNNNGTDIELPDGVDGAMRSLPLPGKQGVQFAILCRVNLPMILTAYHLIGSGKRVCIVGRSQIGEPLKRIIMDLCRIRQEKGRYIHDTEHPDYTGRISDRIEDGEVKEEGLMTRLDNYYKVHAAKLSKEKYEKKLEALEQNVQCIEVIAARVNNNTVEGVLREIDNLFREEPEPGVISLSTVHRAKGLEWDVVFILKPDLLPHPAAFKSQAKSQADCEEGEVSDALQQEYNACYVAATRPHNRLYYIRDFPIDPSSRRGLLDFDEADILAVNLDGPDQDAEPPRAVPPMPNEVVRPAQPVAMPAEDKPVVEDDESEAFVDDGEPF